MRSEFVCSGRQVLSGDTPARVDDRSIQFDTGSQDFRSSCSDPETRELSVRGPGVRVIGQFAEVYVRGPWSRRQHRDSKNQHFAFATVTTVRAGARVGSSMFGLSI